MIRHRQLVLWTVVILIILGGLFVITRIKMIRKSYSPRGESVWRLVYDIDFSTTSRGKISIAIPDNRYNIRIFRETFAHRGLWMDILRSKKTLAREALVVPLIGHKQRRFIAKFDVDLNVDKQLNKIAPQKKLSAEDRAFYLRDKKTIQVSSPQVADIINQFTKEKTTKNKLFELIFDYCSENITQGARNSPSDAMSTLQQGIGTALGRCKAMIALCRAVKIPARLVTGFVIQHSLDAKIHYWVEAYSQKQFLPYDPTNGYFGELPANFLPIRFGDTKIIKSSNRLDYRSKYSIQRLLSPPVLTAFNHEASWLSIFDLTRLPPSMQEILTLILLLPLGALITAVFRNLVGLETYGTFTPSLIALSFVQADWRTGMVAFFIVMGIGVLGRIFLNKLRLLMVARLSVILIMVVLCMIMAVSILDYLGLTPSASAVLLPMVILTMMIERFNVTAEENGNQEAFIIFVWTLVVAICCLLILRIEYIGRLLLMFPEIQFFNAAALLLIGRYSGYRMTELWRFHDITQK